MKTAPHPWAEELGRIESAPSTAELDAIEQRLFGRKHGTFTLAMKELGALSPEERRVRGQELNAEKQALESALAKRRGELAAAAMGTLAEADAIDVTLELPPRPHGHLHLIPEFIRQVEEVFGRMGFDVARGPEIETEACNFDLLNIPADHPAREAHDTFWLKNQKPVTNNQKTLLRTHTSPVQIHYMRTKKPPFRMICPGKVYRKDADATHSPMFHQVEGLMVGRDVSLANMKAVLIAAIRELIAPDAEFRFRTGYFPFVEPGLEVDMRWRGETSESREGQWLEILGCGMVHPNVLKNVGIDPKKWQGFAFGCGVERMLMIKHHIPDLRSFFAGDLRFLQQW